MEDSVLELYLIIVAKKIIDTLRNLAMIFIYWVWIHTFFLNEETMLRGNEWNILYCVLAYEMYYCWTHPTLCPGKGGII